MATAITQNTSVKAIALKIESKEKGFFSVQIASYPDLKMAQDMEKDLKNKTYPAFIHEAELPGKGTWYRVRIGNFATKEEAELYAKNIRNIDPSIDKLLMPGITQCS